MQEFASLFPEVFRDRVPWLDESVALVGRRVKNHVSLALVAGEKLVHEVCTFSDGDVRWLRQPAFDGVTGGALTSAEILCLCVMPADTDPTRMPEILRHPFWESVLAHMAAFYVMET